jgi:hypothetical protein
MTLSETKWLNAFEDDNANLEKLMAKKMLDLVAMKELVKKNLVTPALNGETVEHLRPFSGS